MLVLWAQVAAAQEVADDSEADSDRGGLGETGRRRHAGVQPHAAEFMRIERLADGGRQFTARIGTRQGPVAFRMVRLTEGEVVFENPAHDFPQRILYRQVAGGLAARIEGRENGKDRAEEFPYRRVPCEAK
mgnify:CR=1 FL=1